MALCAACWVVMRCLDLRERAAAYKKERISCLAAPLELQALELEALGWNECKCKPE